MRKSCCNMNRLLALLLIAVLLQSCAGDDVERSYWDNGNIRSELRYKDGMLNGQCSWYYPNGKMEMTMSYKMNVVEGEVQRWYENGNLQSKCYFKNDQYDSIFESYNVSYATPFTLASTSDISLVFVTSSG